MSPSRFGRFKAILLAVADLPPDARAAYLDEACGDDDGLREEVESALRHDDDAPSILATSGLEGLLGREGVAAVLRELGGERPDVVGPYAIVDVLGEGGMGVVYRAHQDAPIERDVALKLIHRGRTDAAVLARFEMERRTLARLEHPHIARVLDAGSDDDRPYFVMELVDGRPLLDVCRDENLSLRDRLELAVRICRAVQHAHQRGVIHRDLKSSNILVTRQDGVPTPKIIDFGIAKVLEGADGDAPDLTREGQPIGTVRYMSPEQARGRSGDIDTRSDIYALGVILYELLTGVLPYAETATSLFEQMRIVGEAPPRPFREVLPKGVKLDRDLETIVGRALAKSPDERYQSVSDLAADIGFFLSGQPILARTPSAAYQIRKLVQRNRLASGLLAGMVLLLAGFGIWMSYLYAVSEANYRLALEAEGEADQVADFMVGLFEISEPGESRGNTITAREILDEGAVRIDTELVDQPEVRARMMRNMGFVYRSLGIYDRARELLEGALRVKTEDPDVRIGDESHAEILNDLAWLYDAVGEETSALERYREALALRRDLFPADDPRLASSLSNLGSLLQSRGELAEAAMLLEEAVEIFETASPGTRELSAALNNLALARIDQGRLDEAGVLYDRSLAIRERLLPEDHPELALTSNNLANFYWQLGRHAQAKPLAEKAVAIWRRSLGSDHPDLAVALINLASLNLELADREAAQTALDEALAIQEAAFGSDHLQLTYTLNHLGRLCREQGRFAAADSALTRSLMIRRTRLGRDHGAVSSPLYLLAELRREEGRLTEAAGLAVEALAIRKSTYGPDDKRTAVPLHVLGVIRMEQGGLVEADSLLARALAIRERILGPVHPRIADTLEARADLMDRLGEARRADDLAARAAAMRDSIASRPRR